MQQTIADWGNWLMVDKSPATVEGYQWELKALAAWLHPTAEPLKVQATDLTRYLADRRLRGAQPATLKRAVCAFRSFFAWTCGAKRSPARNLPIPKVHQHEQRTLTAAQLMDVIASCDTASPVGIRDLALLALVADSGLRAAEVCRLAIAKLALADRAFRVIIKGGREKPGTFSPDTQCYLGAWLALRPQFARPEATTVFVSLGGKTHGAALTTDGLRAVFRYVGRRAGLKNGFSPHDLRRTFATLGIRFGAPTRLIQLAGRWENLAMVQQYTQALRPEDFDPYFPIAGIMRRSG